VFIEAFIPELVSGLSATHILGERYVLAFKIDVVGGCNGKGSTTQWAGAQEAKEG
jgi:folylpolyglutamate synthase/dihydropteroate synthase